MLNQLNDISSLAVGIVSIVAIFVVLVVFLVIGFKKGFKSTFTSLLIFIVSLGLAILLCRPVLNLFDNLFGFSMLFFNAFMLKFGQYQSLNNQVTTTNYETLVNNFKSSDIGMSQTLKTFLEKVFDVSSVKDGATTTLGTIASSTISYMISLFIVSIILCFVIYILLTILYKLIFKRFNNTGKGKLKLLGVIIGLIKSVSLSIILIIILSSLPIFGISTDYLANGFESTKVFNSTYQYIVITEQNIYIKYLNFKDINERASQTKQNLAFGSYNNSDAENAEYDVTVELTLNQIIETFVNKQTLEVGSNTYNYILVNNNLYLYQDSLLKGYWEYKFDNNKIIYKANLDGKTVTYQLK